MALGDGVSRLKERENVAGFIGFPLRGGGYSQYVCVPEQELSLVPDAVTLEAAAALPCRSNRRAILEQSAGPRR